jgi:hypothetical protein
VVAKVTVGTNPSGVAYDSGKGEIFVVNTGVQLGAEYGNYDSVSVITDSPLSVAISVSPSTLYQGQTLQLNSTVTSGTSPYLYQWFSEAPAASSYSPISGATSSNYNFTTSTSTAAGSWNFMLQVTDNAEETAASAVTPVYVNFGTTTSTAPTAAPMQVSTPTASLSSPPSRTPTVPEFPLVMIGAILLIAVTSAILFWARSKKDEKAFCVRRAESGELIESELFF